MLGSRVTCFANAHGDSDAYSHAHPNANRYTHSDRSDSGSVLPHYADRDTRGDAPDSRTCSGRGSASPTSWGLRRPVPHVNIALMKVYLPVVLRSD